MGSKIPNPITAQWLLDRIKMCPDTGCWIWLRGRHSGGYGQFGLQGKKLKAHRFYFEFFRGYKINVPLQALHVCDNPPCCNPWHIFLGTNDDNRADSVSKKRTQRGERHWNAKTTLETVKQIRLATGTMVELASRFGLSPASICRIRKGTAWKL